MIQLSAGRQATNKSLMGGQGDAGMLGLRDHMIFRAGRRCWSGLYQLTLSASSRAQAMSI